MNTIGVKGRLLGCESLLRLWQDPTIRGRCEQARNHLLIAQIAVKRGLDNSLVQREILRAHEEIRVVKRLLEADSQKSASSRFASFKHVPHGCAPFSRQVSSPLSARLRPCTQRRETWLSASRCRSPRTSRD